MSIVNSDKLLLPHTVFLTSLYIGKYMQFWMQLHSFRNETSVCVYEQLCSLNHSLNNSFKTQIHLGTKHHFNVLLLELFSLTEQKKSRQPDNMV